MPEVLATRAQSEPKVTSLSRMRNPGVCPYGVASRELLGDPGIDRMEGNCHMHHTCRVFRSMMKKAKSEWKKRSVTGKKSHAQISWAWLCKEVLQLCEVGRVGWWHMYFRMVRLET